MKRPASDARMIAEYSEKVAQAMKESTMAGTAKINTR